MRAMILAAGFGTRLRPLTNDRPKALLPVDGRPLIHYTLLLLKRYGITDIMINLHHHGQKITDVLGDGSALGVSIRYSWEETILGTGGGIKHAADFLGRGTFLLINSDIVVDLNLDKVVEYHHRRKATVSMVLRADPDAAAYGAIEIDGQDRVRRILGRGSQASGPLRQLMFTGVHILEPSVLDWIPAGGFSSITDAYIAMLLRDEKLFGYVMKGAWMDLGTPERYQEANRLLESGQLKLGYLRGGEGAPAQRPRTRPVARPAKPARRRAVAQPGKSSRTSRTGR